MRDQSDLAADPPYCHSPVPPTKDTPTARPIRRFLIPLTATFNGAGSDTKPLGTAEPSSRSTYDDPLAVFENQDTPGTPLTTSEVADALDCARRTAYGKLEALADDGQLRTKKVGARGRVR